MKKLKMKKITKNKINITQEREDHGVRNNFNKKALLENRDNEIQQIVCDNVHS